jgi:hypothetical protein
VLIKNIKKTEESKRPPLMTFKRKYPSSVDSAPWCMDILF